MGVAAQVCPGVDIESKIPIMGFIPTKVTNTTEPTDIETKDENGKPAYGCNICNKCTCSIEGKCLSNAVLPTPGKGNPFVGADDWHVATVTDSQDSENEPTATIELYQYKEGCGNYGFDV